jgi:hypothetical protein
MICQEVKGGEETEKAEGKSGKNDRWSCFSTKTEEGEKR